MSQNLLVMQQDVARRGMAVPDLDPFRDKIQSGRKLDSQPPFQYASLDSFPTAAERPLIARWATLRDACIGRERAINPIPPNATPLDEAFIRQEIAFGSEAEAKVSELVVSLYQTQRRSEEHTSELQSHLNLVCRLLLDKKKITDSI